MKSSKTIIIENKKLTIIQYDFDDVSSTQKIYSNNNNLKNDIMSIAIKINLKIK